MPKALVTAVLALSLAPTASAATAPRIVYSSDWSGARQIYSVDPRSPGKPAQLTPALQAFCNPEEPCGFTAPQPSPDGRKILFADVQSCKGASLYVANADGTVRRRLGTHHGCGGFESAWTPDSRRLAYGVDGSLYVANADGGGRRIIGKGSRPAWSTDGRSLAFRSDTGYRGARMLVVRQNGRNRVVARYVEEFAWSPTGKWIAFYRQTSDPWTTSVELIRPTGTSPRRVRDDYAFNLGWSRDGRFIAFAGSAGLQVVETVTGKTTTLRRTGITHRWAPRGSRLAFDSPDGITLFNAASGTSQQLTSDHARELEWRPDGGAIAYVAATELPWPYDGGDLRVATTAGQVRTVVAAEGAHGGSVATIAWAKSAGKLRYRPAGARTIAEIAPTQVTAPWTIARIAADRQRVAYIACGHIFLWTPSRREVVQADPTTSFSPQCSYFLYDLALAGDRIAFGARVGNAGQTWSLFQRTFAPVSRTQELARASGANGCVNSAGGFGNLVGAGDLLVFSRWEDVSRPGEVPCAEILRQDVQRLDVDGCPCPILATSPGPLLPTDVSDGRVALVGRNETLVLDRAGAQLLAVPIHGLAAQLSGSSLVILVARELREYDVSSGTLRRGWPMPDVPSSGQCGNPHPLACTRAQLVLQDVARGLVTYVLDGQVHLLRLADGADAAVAAGTTARFMDDGLVYADGPRLRLVEFASLPLRGF